MIIDSSEKIHDDLFSKQDTFKQLESLENKIKILRKSQEALEENYS
jgi:chaperonin cofactor prefoldin